MSTIGNTFGNQSKSYLEALLQGSLNSYKAFAQQVLTVSGSIQNLTIPDGAKYAKITVDSNASGVVARYLEFGGSGTPVSSTIGLSLRDGTVFDIIDAQNLFGFQVIETASHTTTLYIQYYK